MFSLLYSWHSCLCSLGFPWKAVRHRELQLPVKLLLSSFVASPLSMDLVCFARMRCCRPLGFFLSHTTGDVRRLTAQEVKGTTGRRRSWHRMSTARFVVAKTKDVIFWLPLVQHTLQTESWNTCKNLGCALHAHRKLSRSLRNLSFFSTEKSGLKLEGCCVHADLGGFVNDWFDRHVVWAQPTRPSVFQNTGCFRAPGASLAPVRLWSRRGLELSHANFGLQGVMWVQAWINRMMCVLSDSCLLKENLCSLAKISSSLHPWAPPHLSFTVCLSHWPFGFTAGITSTQTGWKEARVGEKTDFVD